MKKESLKELLERLDAQAAQFNSHLTEANRLFDKAAKKMESLITREEKQLHATIQKVKNAVNSFGKEKKSKDQKDKSSS
jgi:DNA-binding protein H-NS